MKISNRFKRLLIGIILIIIFILEYLGLKIISVSLGDKDLINYYIAIIGSLLVASVSLFVLYVQITTNHRQFVYNQKKNNISELIDLSIKYLNIYKLEVLKQFLYDWQFAKKSQGLLTTELKEFMENADNIGLKFSFTLNAEDSNTKEFLKLQTSNYKCLCEIFEDLRILFCFRYSETEDTTSKALARISNSRPRLRYCLTEKLLEKAIFDDYNLSYEKVKNEIYGYINSLKNDLNITLNIFEKTQNGKP